MDTLDRYVTVEEVARQLRVHPQSVRRWLRSGVLVGASVGNAWRIRPEAVESFLAGRLGRPTLRRRPQDATL